MLPDGGRTRGIFHTAKEHCAGPCMHPDEQHERLSGGKTFLLTPQICLIFLFPA